MTPYAYLTALNREGVDLKTIQAIAGHEDECMALRTYIHCDETLVTKEERRWKPGLTNDRRATLFLSCFLSAYHRSEIPPCDYFCELLNGFYLYSYRV